MRFLPFYILVVVACGLAAALAGGFGIFTGLMLGIGWGVSDIPSLCLWQMWIFGLAGPTYLVWDYITGFIRELKARES